MQKDTKHLQYFYSVVFDLSDRKPPYYAEIENFFLNELGGCKRSSTSYFCKYSGGIEKLRQLLVDEKIFTKSEIEENVEIFPINPIYYLKYNSFENIKKWFKKFGISY